MIGAEIMSQIQSSNSGEPITTNSRIIKISDNFNPLILNKNQWIRENSYRLPVFYSDDYSFVVDLQYQNYLKYIEYSAENHSGEVTLSEPTETIVCEFNNILLTLQSTVFNGSIELILCECDGVEVVLCRLSDLNINDISTPHFVDHKVDIVDYLNIVLPYFKIMPSQTLKLHVSGGVLLTDNLLVCATYKST
jgi:hypothetical protein